MVPCVTPLLWLLALACASVFACVLLGCTPLVCMVLTCPFGMLECVLCAFELEWWWLRGLCALVCKLACELGVVSTVV